jgi:hypothetical protein
VLLLLLRSLLLLLLRLQLLVMLLLLLMLVLLLLLLTQLKEEIRCNAIAPFFIHSLPSAAIIQQQSTSLQRSSIGCCVATVQKAKVGSLSQHGAQSCLCDNTACVSSLRRGSLVRPPRVLSMLLKQQQHAPCGAAIGIPAEQLESFSKETSDELLKARRRKKHFMKCCGTFSYAAREQLLLEAQQITVAIALAKSITKALTFFWEGCQS